MVWAALWGITGMVHLPGGSTSRQQQDSNSSRKEATPVSRRQVLAVPITAVLRIK
eukprot:CAMPEP_0185436584 /NCGR_PEP_ID=MMETSP1365-20130426/28291_1 /TAXON_ID=38817 /ORGANISM="Gephyrocapsa oceanica, Strain RCC1303" /LENGTH=54 /DNA_ID=CAMNT_0028041417 /DNA_START=1 /DNA_END=163 /DNA_ORIENTATION=+